MHGRRREGSHFGGLFSSPCGLGCGDEGAEGERQRLSELSLGRTSWFRRKFGGGAGPTVASARPRSAGTFPVLRWRMMETRARQGEVIVPVVLGPSTIDSGSVPAQQQRGQQLERRLRR